MASPPTSRKSSVAWFGQRAAWMKRPSSSVPLATSVGFGGVHAGVHQAHRLGGGQDQAGRDFGHVMRGLDGVEVGPRLVEQDRVVGSRRSTILPLLP